MANLLLDKCHTHNKILCGGRRIKKYLVTVLILSVALCFAGCSAFKSLDTPTNLRVEDNVLKWDRGGSKSKEPAKI